MPWEETEDYIRSGHKDPDKYDRCRTTEISGEQGIKAVYCKLKTSENWEVQSYLFDREKWTLAKAKKWFAAHNAQVSVLQVGFDADRVVIGPRWTSAPVTLTRTGVHNGKHKPAEVIRAMGDNNTCMVPVVFDHPPGTDEDPEIHDPNLFIGVVNELHVGISKGEPAYQGMIHLLNVPETEQHRAAMRAGQPLEVSIGFWFDHREGKGEYNDVKYDGIEENIRVFHLGLMKDVRAACSIEDGCGIGVSSQQCSVRSLSSNGGVEVVEMTDEDVSKLTLEQIAEKNACVKNLQDEHAARDKELKAKLEELAALNKRVKELQDKAAGKDELAEKVAALEKEMPELKAAKDELNARKQAEKEARINDLIKRAGKDSGLKAEDLKEASEAELDRLDKVLPQPERRSGGTVAAYNPPGHDEEDEPIPMSLGLNEDRYYGMPQGEVHVDEGGDD